MSEIQIASYGSWQSPITSDLIVSETVRLSDIVLSGSDVFWVEMRPSESGRNVIVKCTPDGKKTDVTPADFNVRTRVHEYGGRSYTVSGADIYYSNFADQQIYHQTGDSDPVPVTSDSGLRFADLIVDERRHSLICVCEDHGREHTEPENKLIRIDTAGGGPIDSQSIDILASGSDFYASPCLNPVGSRLAWLSWNHPNMPWDGTELWEGYVLPNGKLDQIEKVAGGPEESIFQPQWSPDGTLYFVSDRSGWWNLCRRDGDQVRPVLSMDAEFGMPQWLFGMSTFAFESAQRLICSFTREGTWRLAEIELTADKLQVIDTPYTDIACLQAAPGIAAFIGGTVKEPAAVVRLDLDSKSPEILQRSSPVDLDDGFIAIPQSVEFPTADELRAHAFFYKPTNKNFQAPVEERAPLIVISHGGPTASTSQSLNLGIQYWTSRGVAVLDVNYGGSTGYGRAYRQRLTGRWGIVDREDCANGAIYAVEQFSIDPDRLIIRGSSAGGYTTLCALVFDDVFKAGASYYGISDLEALAKETHKFESRYLDNLIGPYPERQDLYVARSPIHHAEHLDCPIIFFQGLEDRVVPPQQAEMMVAILKDKKLPVAYITFEKEQHGFRKAPNIKRALDAELYFYSRIFGFEPANGIEPVEIENI